LHRAVKAADGQASIAQEPAVKAIVIREWNDPQKFPLEEVEEPTAAPGEVVIAVHTAAIVFGDMLVATGRYQVKPTLPFTPGAECSGVIEAVGEGVSEFKVGDRVAAIGFVGNSREGRLILGSCREKVALPVWNVVKIPDNVDLERASLFRSNTETSYLGLQQGQLKAGETLLVLGAGGGTGYAAVELGKAMGARVIGSASSEEKRAIARQAGADFTIDTRASDWRAQVEAIVGKKGVDVVYDPTGGDMSELAFRTLGYGGRFVVIGFAAGTIPKLPLNLPLMKQAFVVPANLLRAYEMEPDRCADNARYLMGLLGEGKLTVPPVAKRYSLEQAGEAYADVAAGKTAGRVVITIGG
jgi:NADPH2:quinone reductase